MRTFSSYKVFFHYPTTADELNKLKIRVANISADEVISCISKLDCSKLEKKRLINKIINDIKIKLD